MIRCVACYKCNTQYAYKMESINTKYGEIKMNQMQERLLDILKWYHQYCIEHELKYYILGGSLIGAVRHKGFIPWDDDIDVGMPRKDYEKFLQLTSEKIINHYKVEKNGGSSKAYYYLFAKVYDTNTTLVERKQKTLKRGIYIDVFPLDGIGNSRDEAKRNFKKVVRLEKILYTRQCVFRRGRKWYKNIAILASQLIPCCFIDEMKLYRLIERRNRQNDFYHSKYVGNLVGSYYEKEIVPNKVFGEPKLYTFEDTVVYGVADYDTYLSQIYGDYMKLPPEGKRCTTHSYYKLDLEKSYLETS